MKPQDQTTGPFVAVVSWEDGSSGPTVTPVDILVPAGNRNVPIRWECGANVAELEITGLDPDVFHPAASQGMVLQFTTTDANLVKEDYEYTVGATRTTGETTVNDPRIRNGG